MASELIAHNVVNFCLAKANRRKPGQIGICAAYGGPIGRRSACVRPREWQGHNFPSALLSGRNAQLLRPRLRPAS